MSGNVTLTAGATQTFNATFSLLPVDVVANPPKATIYSDSARTVVAVARASMVATGNPNVWTATVPGTLAAGTYYLKFEAVYTIGQAYTADSNDTLTLVSASVNLGGSLAQVSDVRSSTSDVLTSPLAYLWRNQTDAQLLTYLTRASSVVEQMAGVRLIPFTSTEDVEVFVDSTPNARQYGNILYGSYNPSLNPGFVQNFAAVAWVQYSPTLRPEMWSGLLTAATLLDPSTTPPSSVTLDVSKINYQSNDGVLRFSQAAAPLAKVLRVTYTGGYAPVPQDLIEATIYLAADAFVVGVDARDGQMDAADLYARAMSRITPWQVKAPRQSIG